MLKVLAFAVVLGGGLCLLLNYYLAMALHATGH